MKKNIIYIIGTLQVGGAERHLATILPQLTARGWSLEVMTLFQEGPLAIELKKKGIPVHLILNERYLKILQFFPILFRRIIRLISCLLVLSLKLKAQKNTILHFFLPEAYVVGMIGSSLSKFQGPRIMSRRSLNYYQKRRPTVGWFEKKLHKKTTLIVGNSQAVFEQLQKEEKLPKERLRLIYNGIDPVPYAFPKDRDKIRQELKIPQDAFVMIHVANLIPYKAHIDLLIALNKIKDKLISPWYLLCVGRDDGIGSFLQDKTEALGLNENVLWLGARNDIPDLLACANIGILCSHEEGFSNVILEGMAAGLPMVVTDVGGNKEAVLHNSTGYVVPPKDSEELAKAIFDLAMHPEKILQFGQAGKLRVEQYFSLNACVDAYEKLYESLS